MSQLFDKFLSRGPYSAVAPYTGGGSAKVGKPSAEEAPDLSEPEDGFESSDELSATERPGSRGQSLAEPAERAALQVALGAFPQVIHLLVDPSKNWGERLSEETGLPSISLADGEVENLATELQGEKYKDGFILEGFPRSQDAAEDLDDMLSEVSPENRRVLSWELFCPERQELIDHYTEKDLLWMVPVPEQPNDEESLRESVLSCLQGLPAVQS